MGRILNAQGPPVLRPPTAKKEEPEESGEDIAEKPSAVLQEEVLKLEEAEAQLKDLKIEVPDSLQGKLETT